MKEKIITMLAIFLMMGGLFAESEKSRLKAVAMSAVFPGTGQAYLGNSTKASIFMATDIMIVGSLIRFNKERDLAIDNYKTVANVKASLRKDAPENMYSLINRFRSSDEYNNYLAHDLQNALISGQITQEQQMEYYEMYKIQESDQWKWELDSSLNEYRRLRREKQSFELYGNLTLGAIFLNRIISVLDVTIFSNKLNKDNQLYSMPDFDRKGITLIYEYKF